MCSLYQYLSIARHSIPIFFLSFLKMPRGVWQKLFRLQRDFLWGESLERKKISWVRWEEVCTPNTGGGLGMKDLRAFSQSLLSKWKWKLLEGNSSLWYEVLVAKYGPEVREKLLLSSISSLRLASTQWKYLCLLGTVSDYDDDWFRDRIAGRLGNGVSTFFWHDTWIETQPS